jgi:hypothetical protein
MRLLTLAVMAVLAASTGARADCNHPTPVQFASGASSASVASGPQTAAVECYRVDARAGQNMSVVVSGAGNAVVAVYAPGWTTSCDSTGDCDITGDLLGDGDTADWSDDLAETGAYLIVVDNSRGGAAYQLDVDMQ